MDEYSRHLGYWKFLSSLACPFAIRRFRFESDPIEAEGPILLVSNHVTSWDMILIAAVLRGRQIYFVASEHLFRAGLLSALLQRVFAPIARRKGATATDTVRECLRRMREGRSVCVFAEGEQTWDGRSIPAVKGTGSLARAAGATLVTYRLEGGYLSLPRWARGLRRGRMRGRLMGVYPPETLKKMSSAEVNDLIDRDIYEDAWKRQESERTEFISSRGAEYLERMLYLCPRCMGVGGLRSRGGTLRCACGLELRYTNMGLFEPPEPFADLAGWEDWQAAHLCDVKPAAPGGALFCDEGLRLSKLSAGHRQTVLGRGALAQYEDRLVCADRSFPLGSIEDMAMTRFNKLLFTADGEYYEIRSRGRVNLRKYLELWKQKR